MIQISAELLALTSEPALLVRGGRLLFANDAAYALLGPDCLEKSFAALFGAEIAGMQAPAFVGEAEVAGRRFILRIRALKGARAVFLSPCETMGELISESFLYTLRSELMQLSVCTQRLRASVTGEDTQSLSSLRIMLQSLYRLNRTLQNLSVIRGAEQGTLFFHPQPLELCRLLSDLLDSVRLNVRSPEISFCAPESLPVKGDPELLEQLVLNLLSNCLRHAEGCTRIRVSLHGAGDQVILSVDDDGCGIPGDRLHTALERYRYAGWLSAADDGPGLGLTAVREIARLHGGTVLLESREGVGTAVRVSLSRAAVPHGVLHSPMSEYGKNYDSILTGLASCLPPEAFDVPDRR